MALTFDATLKDMGRDCPEGFLATFDRPPTLPVALLNVDLSAVTRSADLAVALGDPPVEVVHLEFQSSASAWKHADVLAYNALLYAHYHVPVHTIVLLLRPEAAHENMTGHVRYTPRSEDGKMEFVYRVVRLWDIDADRLLCGELGLMPLAVLGRLPESLSPEQGIASVARRMVDRLSKDSSPERAGKLLTKALLLTGLRVRRDVALKIFRGIRMMEESDTYLMLLEEGGERATRDVILGLAENQLGPADESVIAKLNAIADLPRLKRMAIHAPRATTWQELLETP